MRSIIAISIIGTSIINTSPNLVPEIQTNEIQQTFVTQTESTIALKENYTFETQELGEIKGNLESFKAVEEEKYRIALEEEAKRKAEEEARRAQEIALREQLIAEENARIAAQQAAAKVAASQISIPTGGDIKGQAYNLIKSLGYSDQDWAAIDFIINKESTWNPNAVNSSSGACGLAQALPCTSAKFGAHQDYKTNWQSQIRWFLDYVNARYGSPAGAYDFWIVNRWY